MAFAMAKYRLLTQAARTPRAAPVEAPLILCRFGVILLREGSESTLDALPVFR